MRGKARAVALLLLCASGGVGALEVLTSTRQGHCAAYMEAQRSNASIPEVHRRMHSDDFCDCLSSSLGSGEEAQSSSACSFYTAGKRVFQCKNEIGGAAILLFASRHNDGVCDCCDGSDEDSFMNGGKVCEDTCETDLVQARRVALLWHRTVQAGKHSRQDLINELERKRRKEAETFNNLEDQLRDLKAISITMQRYLFLHSPREDMERFRLLRERLFQCVYGVHERCNLFHPEFFDSSEHVEYDAPASVLEKRKPRPKLIHSENEISYSHSLTGIARVRATLCEKPDIFRDDTNYIPVAVGDLVNYLNSPAGKSPVRVRHNEKTLYGRFFDEGEYGRLMFFLALGELLSIVALPATGLVYAVHLGFTYASEQLWNGMITCATPTSGTALPEVISSLCRIAQNTQVPGTAESNILNILDLRSYSVFLRLYDYFDPIFTWPARMARLAWHGPIMYYQFYFTRAKEGLPARRMCCLLRAGLNSTNEELARMSNRLKEEYDLREALKVGDQVVSSVPVDEVDYDNNLDTPGDKLDIGESGKKAKEKARRERAKSKKAKKKLAKKATNVVLVDYGLRKEWEAVKGMCLEKEFGGYQYKFCFFKEIKQGVTLLGKFSGWGGRESSLQLQTQSEMKTDAYYSTQVKDLPCILFFRSSARLTPTPNHYPSPLPGLR